MTDDLAGGIHEPAPFVSKGTKQGERGIQSRQEGLIQCNRLRKVFLQA